MKNAGVFLLACFFAVVVIADLPPAGLSSTGSAQAAARRAMTPRWETQSTSFKDCYSSVGVWNDPPVLRLSVSPKTPIRVGKGRIHLLNDSSIAAISEFFQEWQGKRVACLHDGNNASIRERCRKGEYLFPRYLFQAGILCQRIYPSSETGFVDENRAFYWPVATTGVDVILWVNSQDEISPVMRTLHIRHVLREFLERGGELYLGGQARDYLPYLLDDAVMASAWPGLQHLKLLAMSSAQQRRVMLSDACAKVNICDKDGTPLEPVGYDMEHHAHGYATTVTYENETVLVVRVCFAEQDHVVLEWRVGNASDSPQRLGLTISGTTAVQGLKPAYCTAYEKGIICDLTERMGIKTHLMFSCAGHARWTMEGQKYKVALPGLKLASGELHRGTLVVALSLDPSAPSSALQKRVNTIANDWGHWKRAEDRWQGAFDKLPRIPNDTPQRRWLLRRALSAIVGNTWQSPKGLPEGIYGSRRIITVQRSRYPLWYLYEASFYAVGVRNFDPAMARDQITLAGAMQYEDGFIPASINNYRLRTRRSITQIPCLAYGAWQTYLADPNTDFLDQVYGVLSRYIDWWYANRQPRSDGTFGFVHSHEGGGDDTPRADETSGEYRAGMNKLISPDACGFVLMETQSLARIAEVLGRHEDAAKWRLRAEKLSQRLLDVCYDPKANMFWDVDIATDRFRESVTPWHFVPLWAGVGLDDTLAHQMVKEHLVEKLLGEVPFPIISPDHPAYLPDAYWRGPSWPQLWQISLQVLWWYGFEQEADAAADKLLEMCGRHPYIMEIYDSNSGQGLSIPEYSFASTALFEIALRRYRDDPPWKP